MHFSSLWQVSRQRPARRGLRTRRRPLEVPITRPQSTGQHTLAHCVRRCSRLSLGLHGQTNGRAAWSVVRDVSPPLYSYSFRRSTVSSQVEPPRNKLNELHNPYRITNKQFAIRFVFLVMTTTWLIDRIAYIERYTQAVLVLLAKGEAARFNAQS